MSNIINEAVRQQNVTPPPPPRLPKFEKLRQCCGFESYH